MRSPAIPARCPACGVPDPRPWRRARSAEPADDATYLLVRCGACGTAATAGGPPPAAHETGAYAPGRPPRGARAAAPLLARFDRRRLALVRSVVPPPARLLDAGAGRGRFVAAARAAGYDAVGIEPSARARAPCVEPVAIEEHAAAELDAVTTWHVLEHLEDPAKAAARIAEWLRPGGVLVAGVPNLGSLQARIGGPDWYHLDVPRHRTHFTEPGMRALLARSGFRVRSVHHVLAEHNPFGLWQSAVSRATPTQSWLYHALKRNAPVRAADLLPTLAALPLAPVAAAAEWTAGMARRGGTIAVVAVRRS